MPKGQRIWLIRHGESIANAGLPTNDIASIPLTIKGQEQAAEAVLALRAIPDIFTSLFMRARQTAQYILKRYSNAKLKICADLREFTYLAPETCVNTTRNERKARVETYWAKLDPYYIDGKGAESFAQLIQRVNRMLSLLLTHEYRFIAVVSHEQFIKAFLLCRYDSELSIENKMEKFITMDTIENASVREVRYYQGTFCKLKKAAVNVVVNKK